ncbi:hypothetical protein BBOV_II001070 [Babesia bovis T2Bo]|uniref:hypothetical protein n=1 Tax=Babesia bovis T2Bo TaxID=484906 RepID=UPI001C361524|nr:hypothetical protein BBOV_II001070 [Babesia bovis T2Bo]EDO06066.2 hypothetical protein BBOV_II001070 [Babesia bovis T2Bo]
MTFSVIFNTLNSMSRADRQALEKDFFDKHALAMEAVSHRLYDNLDFEEKVSLVELLWRGVRRAGNAKATRAMSTKPKFPFRGIKLLSANCFEQEAIAWLEKTGCLTESHGFYKTKGTLELVSSSSKSLFYDFVEIIMSPAMLRAHLMTNGTCLKVEVPYASMAKISIESSSINLRFNLFRLGYNIIGLWSPPLQRSLCHLFNLDDVFDMKLEFTDGIPLGLVDSINGLGKLVNTSITEEPPFAEKSLSSLDSASINDANAFGDEEAMNHEVISMLPGSLIHATSIRKKAESRLEYDSPSDDYKLIDKLSNDVEFPSSPSSVGYNQASLSLSSDISNSVSSSEKSYNESILEPSHRSLQLQSSVEPLMTSLGHYRETKAKELSSIFKRIFREECDQARAEISKCCLSHESQRRQLQETYKKQVETLVKEIESNHNELNSQLKSILAEFDRLRNTTVGTDIRKIEKLRTQDNSMISNCTGLVEFTESAIKEIDEVIEQIKAHYVKKKIDCSKALKSL